MQFALSPEQVQFAETLDSLLAKSDVARAWAAGDHAPGLAVWRKLADLGVTPHVPFAVDADVAERVFVVHGGVLSTAEVKGSAESVDPCRKLFEVTAAQEIGPLDGGFERGVLACSAQLLGAGRALLARSVEYVKQRTQFGKPIGSYQAVKHQLADVHVGLELARPLVYGAAIGEADVSAAKVAAGDAAYRAARAALQVHGAIGYTIENDLSLWLTKVRALHSVWGNGSMHRARLMTALDA
jgi:hypothetical protein